MIDLGNKIIGFWTNETRISTYNLVSVVDQEILNLNNPQWEGGIQISGSIELMLGPYLWKIPTEGGGWLLRVSNIPDQKGCPHYTLTWYDAKLYGDSSFCSVTEDGGPVLFSGSMELESFPGEFVFKESLFYNAAGDPIELKGILSAPRELIKAKEKTSIPGAYDDGFPILLESIDFKENGICEGVEFKDDIVSKFEGAWSLKGQCLLIDIKTNRSQLQCFPQFEEEQLALDFVSTPDTFFFERNMGLKEGSIKDLELKSQLRLKRGGL